MKTRAYRLRERLPGVDVLEVAEIEIGLDLAIEQELGPLPDDDDDEGDPLLGSRARPDRRRRFPLYFRNDFRPAPMCLRAGRGARRGGSFTGLVVHRSRSDLIEFLLTIE